MAQGNLKVIPRRKQMRLTKHSLLKHSELLVVQSMTDINADMHQWSAKILIRKLKILVLTQELESLKMKNYPIKYIILPLEIFRGARYIWGVDLADVQLISKYNKGVKFLLVILC